MAERRLLFDGLVSKRDAIDAIDAVDGAEVFALVHDTFHHTLSAEVAFFPERTGLVHISGVEDTKVAVSELKDEHRVLVGGADILGNLQQIRMLVRGGYRGAFSFEPFAASVHAMDDIEDALRRSMDLIRSQVLVGEAARRWSGEPDVRWHQAG